MQKYIISPIIYEKKELTMRVEGEVEFILIFLPLTNNH